MGGRGRVGMLQISGREGARKVGSVFVATAGNANPESRVEEGRATLNETLLGHSIRVTGPLLSRHRGPCCQAASAPRSHGPSEGAREVQTNSAAARQGSDVAAALPTHDDVLRVTVAVRAQGSVRPRPPSRLRSELGRGRSAGHCPMIVTHSAAVGGDAVARSFTPLRSHLFLHRSMGRREPYPNCGLPR